MAREILPADDFRGVHAAGSLAYDAIATAIVSALWAAAIGATQRRIAAIAEALPSNGGIVAATARIGSGCGSDAGNRRKATASGDAAWLRAARIFSAGQCRDGAGAGGGGMRGGQSGGPALLR